MFGSSTPRLSAYRTIPNYHVNPSASGYIFRFIFWSLSDVSYSDRCRTKKAFQYAKKMPPLFRAIVKFCSTNSLFTYSKLLIYHSGYCEVNYWFQNILQSKVFVLYSILLGCNIIPDVSVNASLRDSDSVLNDFPTFPYS